ncbi:general substrate transporter [Xylariaceae sp. FL0016]|nr:general substrate transporter [Xylariaceae sp. FL0016]
MSRSDSPSAPARRILPLIPRSQKLLILCLILTSMIDSVLVGYDSSLMGSLNVMPSYTSYFTLTTATKALNTSISYLGGIACSPFSGFIVDWRGRKECIFWSALITLIGGVIQGAAQNIGMFIAGRFIVGFGLALAQVATPTLVAETTPVQYRGFAMGVYYACWGVGTLIASGVCYGTASLTTTWAWRIPSLLQAFPSCCCFVILLFVPESPRWLIDRDRHDEALQILSIANGADRSDDPLVLVQYKEIVDTISWERSRGLSLPEVLSQKSYVRRITIAVVFSFIVMLPGTNLVTFYFGDMLSQAGIEDSTRQLQINVILTSWSLVVAWFGSYYADAIGRRTLALLSLSGGIVTLYLLGGLTALYGESTDSSGIYATIAMIFLYNGTYYYGITPLTVLYPTEILSFDIRAVGMGIYTFTTKLAGLFVAMAIPFGFAAIGWKIYIINASIDFLMVVFVWFCFVETRGLTLEEVDELFDNVKHSDVPDLAAVKEGTEKVDVEVLSHQVPISSQHAVGTV